MVISSLFVRRKGKDVKNLHKGLVKFARKIAGKLSGREQQTKSFK
jgi:hypothetical protein